MMVVEIRPMRAEDVPEILRIERVSYSIPWSETSFHSEIHSRQALAKVADCDDMIIGYICARRVLDEGHLLNMTVHPEFRRRGVATLMLSAVLDELKDEGCAFLYLEVRASNGAARRVYEHFGFRHIGTRKRYYVSPAEDAVVMMRDMTREAGGR